MQSHVKINQPDEQTIVFDFRCKQIPFWFLLFFYLKSMFAWSYFLVANCITIIMMNKYNSDGSLLIAICQISTSTAFFHEQYILLNYHVWHGVQPNCLFNFPSFQVWVFLWNKHLRINSLVRNSLCIDLMKKNCSFSRITKRKEE